jgi:hypothetical protein
MLRNVIRFLLLAYAAAALFYLALGATVLFGPFGLRPDPQTALPILFVGAPWSFLMLPLITGKEPAVVIFTLLGLLPLGLNVLALWLLQRWLGRRAGVQNTPGSSR